MAEPLVLLTGATGFVGPHVVAALRVAGYRLRLAQRRPAEPVAGVETVAIGDLARPVDWGASLRGVDAVVHMAGLAHAGPGLDEELYRRINTQATLELARAAQAAGTRRFVYLSSIKAVTGAFDRAPVLDEEEPAPDDAYGRSKRAAEQGLAELDLDWVSLRPVLIYGEGVKANMAALLRLARLPLPLPLGGLRAPRSLLAVENLASAILFAISEACPPRRSYILADPEPIAVANMLAALRAGAGRKPGLVAVPEAFLRRLARLAGRDETFLKLAGSLVARPDALLRVGWRPAVETRAALMRLSAPRRAD
ncbi:NAD-dependent epimerase/dehydratase family protein [Bosea sp. (in: a-proteobacteria)]|uniref:NAD-dependent epimerase/dehydratase family protein n=1 Tax=Bosea sp. (in: a-proteobacteria) TaxID=1871050 RepID=UPI003B3A27D5